MECGQARQWGIYYAPSRSLVLTLLVLSFFSSVRGQDLRDPQFMVEARKGFDQIFNLDYDPAIKTFSALKAKHPQHPAPPFYLATAIWLRELFEREDLDLDKFVAPGYFNKPTAHKMPPEQRRAFFDLIGQSQKLTRAILEEHPNNKDARYFLGSSYGVLGAFFITIDHSKGKAFKYGKKAYKYHRELVEEDPDYYDAYMSVGLYEYIVANLPWYIKWFAVIIGYRGSEERGFDYLSLAAEKGQYVADEARVLQMVLYVREKQYKQALKTARDLHQKYARSFLLHLNQAQILEKMKKKRAGCERISGGARIG